MAKRRRKSSGKRRRRNPEALVVNPSRRRRRRARRANPGHRRRRRRNPIGRSIKHGFVTVLKTALPATIGGLILGLVDAKFLGSTGTVGRTIAKGVMGILFGGFSQRFLGESGAAAATAVVMGSIGHEFGLRLGGGIVSNTKKAGVAELVQMAAMDSEVRGELEGLVAAGEPVSYDGTRVVDSLQGYMEDMANYGDEG